MYVRLSLISFYILLQNEIENEVMKKIKVLLYNLNDIYFLFIILYFIQFWNKIRNEVKNTLTM